MHSYERLLVLVLNVMFHPVQLIHLAIGRYILETY